MLFLPNFRLYFCPEVTLVTIKILLDPKKIKVQKIVTLKKIYNKYKKIQKKTQTILKMFYKKNTKSEKNYITFPPSQNL